MFTVILPFLIGVTVGLGLYRNIGWWGFLFLFPWIGFSITVGEYLRKILPFEKKAVGRKVSILLVMPSLLFFVPIANNENLQLEGIVFLLSIGFFSKGVIHYAVAKIFGPLIWGRGFCGWACWTAAILEWLPIENKNHQISSKLKNIRYLSLFISVGLPLILILGFSFDVKSHYFNKHELIWMLSGNIIYYFAAISLAFYYQDRRAFCKIACPVAIIMKVPTHFALVRRKPSEKECVFCGKCNEICPMDIDVMSYISKGKKVLSTECILCLACIHNCPTGAIK